MLGLNALVAHTKKAICLLTFGIVGVINGDRSIIHPIAFRICFLHPPIFFTKITRNSTLKFYNFIHIDN